MNNRSGSRNIDLSRANSAFGVSFVQKRVTRGHASRAREKAQKEKSAAKRIGTVLLCVALVLGIAVGAVYFYIDNLFDTGEMGTLSKPTGTQTKNPSSDGGGEEEPDITPEPMTGTMNILVLGIDYSTEDAVERDPIGMTDMILYFRANANDHSMMMVQIPRDMLVGEIGGSEGKINGIFKNSADTANRVNTLAQYITKTLGLPIDNYVTIDMDSLREIVDIFDGIEVYVPATLEYNGSRLEQGWRKLMGKECEFFLRARKTKATPRGDIDRLMNQQYFYSALFRRVREVTIPEMLRFTPVVQKYINTDLSFLQLVQLGMNVLTTPSSNITLGRIPVTNGTGYWGPWGTSSYEIAVVVCDKQETANFLNEYMRPADDPISPSQLGTAEWQTAGACYGSEVRRMGDVDAAGADADGAPEDSVQAAQDAAAAAAQEPGA